jgi:HEAT repeat protein
VRIQARGLVRGELVGPTTVPILERVAGAENESEEVRRMAIEALGRSPHDSAPAALFRLLQPRGLIDLDTTRDYAAVALRHSPAPQATALFNEGLKSSSRRVRKACERAVIGGSG